MESYVDIYCNVLEGIQENACVRTYICLFVCLFVGEEMGGSMKRLEIHNTCDIYRQTQSAQTSNYQVTTTESIHVLEL